MNSLPFDDGADCILGILDPQGVHPDILLEVRMDESKVFPVFDFESLLGKKRKERIEVVGLLLQGFINRNAQNFAMRGSSLKAMPLVVSGAATLRVCDYR